MLPLSSSNRKCSTATSLSRHTQKQQQQNKSGVFCSKSSDTCSTCSEEVLSDAHCGLCRLTMGGDWVDGGAPSNEEGATVSAVFIARLTFEESRRHHGFPPSNPVELIRERKQSHDRVQWMGQIPPLIHQRGHS